MMNNKNRAEYVRRINKSLEFIHSHLDKKLSLDEIAAASYFSPFHFHRIFHGFVGETVNDYVSRKRMEKAARTLICSPELSIMDVAESGGFSSSANFSKSFKLYFGVSPSQLRDPNAEHDSKIGKIYSKYGKAFSPKDLYSQFVTESQVFDQDKLEKMLMNVKVEDFNERVVAYLTAPKGYELDAIFETWDRIADWARSSGIENEQDKRFAICHDNPMITPTEQCRYDASIEVDNDIQINSPYSKTVIPSGKYAVGYYKGDGDKVSNFYMELYSAWLPNSGFEPDDYPPVAHYLNDSRKDGFVEMEVQIKLKAMDSD